MIGGKALSFFFMRIKNRTIYMNTIMAIFFGYKAKTLSEMFINCLKIVLKVIKNVIIKLHYKNVVC